MGKAGQPGIRGKRILLVGGGPGGGHTTPLVAVAEVLQESGADLVWVGDSRSLAERLARRHNIPFRAIRAGKWRRHWSPANLLAPLHVLIGCWQARQIIQQLRPELVFAKGGYVSVPVVLAAHAARIPIVIHESDAVMGWANRLASRLADRILVSGPTEAVPASERAKVIETGIPLRRAFTRTSKGPRSGRPTLLVTGGGQGARPINAVVGKALERLLEHFRVIHITGRADASAFVARTQPGYRVVPFTDDMAGLLKRADLVLTRASATTLAELAMLGRPAILVPLPEAANHHQRTNAARWADAGAAVVFPQGELSADRLIKAASQLLGSPNRLKTMGQAARALAHPDATSQVVTVLVDVLTKGA